jgi:hypothetical protein
MDPNNLTRRGLLGRLAAAVGAVGLVPVLGQSAQAASRRRWGWGGRGWSHRRRWGYGPGWGGYGYGPRYYAPAPRIYNGWGGYGGYGAPYYAPRQMYVAPGYYPMMKNDARLVPDALSLLES